MEKILQLKKETYYLLASKILFNLKKMRLKQSIKFKNKKYKQFKKSVDPYKKNIAKNLFDKCMKVIIILKNICFGLAGNDE